MLRGHQIAYTTVMSTMDNLHRKGWLCRERDGKAYQYWPTMTRGEHSAQLMRAAFPSGGDRELVLSDFIRQMDADKWVRPRATLRRLL